MDNNSISHEFLVVLNQIRKLSHMHHADIKLHMGEFMTLAAIRGCVKANFNMNSEALGVKVSDLSEKIHSTKPATSKMLNSLEDKGYIERITDKKDRRVVYVRLSETGDKVFKEAVARLDDFTIRTVQRMGEEDSKELVRLMVKFYEAMVEEINNKDK